MRLIKKTLVLSLLLLLPTFGMFRINERNVSGNPIIFNDFKIINFTDLKNKETKTNSINYVNDLYLYKYFNNINNNNKLFFNFELTLNYVKTYTVDYKPYTQEQFFNKLSFKESSNNWKKTKATIRRNDDGSFMFIRDKKGKKRYTYVYYIGKYQFGKYAFAEIGKNVSYHKFVKNPNIWSEQEQDEAVLLLMKKNKYYLRKYDHMIGQKIKGVYIDWSGLLAASHLVGNYNVRLYLNTKGRVDPCDGNGVKCSTYIKEFSDYRLELD